MHTIKTIIQPLNSHPISQSIFHKMHSWKIPICYSIFILSFVWMSWENYFNMLFLIHQRITVMFSFVVSIIDIFFMFNRFFFLLPNLKSFTNKYITITLFTILFFKKITRKTKCNIFFLPYITTMIQNFQIKLRQTANRCFFIFKIW